MPQKQLQLQEETIKKKLRQNSMIAGLGALAGFSLLIPAFSLAGSKFDYQEFCFNPVRVEPSDYCEGDKIHKGIAWKIALERKSNPKFKAKVSFLDKLPAENPNAGIYGLCSAGFFGIAFLMFKLGTQELQDNLDLAIWNKKALILERAFTNEQHIGITALRSDHEQEFIKEMMNREHGSAMYDLLSDGERQVLAEKHRQGELVYEAQLNLELATLKAAAAEQAEKQAKHSKETEKLTKEKPERSPSPAASGDEAAKAELIEKLKEHEGGWLHTLVMSNKPIFLIGSQGSWKSYCSATIALTRWYLKGQKLVSITDPHFNKNADESWKELIALEPECYGGAQDWADVAIGIEMGFQRWNHRTLKDAPLTSIWDEQTNWAANEECAGLAKEFVGRCISDPRKSNEAPLIITHSFSNAGTGGGAGFSQARTEGVLQLWLNSDNEMKPLFKGKLIGFKDEDGELIEEMKVTIPKDWFNPGAIAKMFRGANAAS
jgi:hypothetical protein